MSTGTLRRTGVAVAAAAALVAIANAALGGAQPSPVIAGAAPSVTAARSASANGSEASPATGHEPTVAGAAATASPAFVGSTPAFPGPAATHEPSATPGPAATPLDPAPLKALGFRLRATVVPIGYPLPAGASYRYGPTWHAARVGAPLPYESVRGVSASGKLLRAHDGVDIRVKIGTPVLAAFSGVVVDPSRHWRPWSKALYGNVVVIQSTEPASPGYYAINAHLSRVVVSIGQVVRRGQVVGRTGITGNAAGTIPHLHFELRAPFLIDQTWGGVFRRLDVFDPMPSLRVADPHRH